MRPFRTGLLVALFAALLAPATALAAAKDSGAYDAKQLKRGTAEAPAAATAAKVPCQVSSAAYIGSQAADKKTGAAAKDLYEVACTGSVGYLLQAEKAGTVTAFSCLEAQGGEGLPCKLPENADPKPLLQTALAKVAPCTLEKVRSIGQVSDGVYLEVLCAGNVGYVVKTTNPLDLAKPMKADNCLIFDAAQTNLKCTLVDGAARLAVVDTLASQAKLPCPLKDRRYVGALKDGSTAYEAACQDGKGYVLKVDTKGAVTATECVKLPGLCELSDSRQALTEQVGLYTRLAKAAKSDCDVKSYAVFPTQGSTEVVELTCGDGTEKVGRFPASGAGEVYTCAHALIAGYRCAPGKTTWADLTPDLKKLGKNDCTVSEAAPRAKSAKGNAQIEVACADGLPGYLVEYSTPSTPVEALGCRMAGCALPANNKPKT